jgi:hypothetical protein
VDLGDQVPGDGQDVGGQRLEVHRSQVFRVAPGGDSPLEERLDRRGDENGAESPELPQAASKTSGTIAAAVHTMRILLPTEEYS